MKEQQAKQSEEDFCEEVSKLIVGLFIGTKRENVIFAPEVPVDYYNNNQIDMLLLDIKNLEYLFIEFKLKDRKGLLYQLRKATDNGIPVIGIINSEPQKNKANPVWDYLPEERKIFSYTGALKLQRNIIGKQIKEFSRGAKMSKDEQIIDELEMLEREMKGCRKSAFRDDYYFKRWHKWLTKALDLLRQ